MRPIRVLLTVVLSLCAVSMAAQSVKWVVEPLYESIERVDDNLFKIKSGGKYYLFTCNGEKVTGDIPADWITPFVDGRALLLGNSGPSKEVYTLLGFVNKDDLSCKRIAGHVNVKSDAFFSEGLIPVVGQKNKFGFADENGTLIIKCDYKEVKPFSEGFASVVKKGDYYIYIDKTGRELELDRSLKRKIQSGYSFYNGEARVQSSTGVYFINTNGQIVRGGQDSGFVVDRKGRAVPEDDYIRPEEIAPLFDGPVPIRVGEWYGYKTRDTKKDVLPPVLGFAQPFSGGYAIAGKSEKELGILQLIEGSILVEQLPGKYSSDPNSEEVVFRVILPEELKTENVRLSVSSKEMKSKTLTSLSPPGGKTRRELTTDVPRKEDRMVAVILDGGLTLLRKSFSPLVRYESLEVRARATVKRADINDCFGFEVILTNPTPIDMTLTVSVSGKNVICTQDNPITILANSKKSIKGRFTKVIKKESRSLTIVYGDQEIKKSITVIPFIGD
jgi:hypothetical protein